jgi:shikimate kinase
MQDARGREDRTPKDTAMSRADDAPIFLIGYRGTGKTTVARELAARLGFRAVDSDEVVEEEAGKTIARIFAEDGEGAFRELEAKAVGGLSRERRVVVGLGGGAVLREENRRAIRAAGAVIWLQAGVDTILARVAADPATAARRPNLTTAGGQAEVEVLLAKRAPLYRECATLIVDTEGKSAADVAEEISRSL